VNLNPDTSLALMQATQGDATNIINKAKNVSNDKKAAQIDAVAKDFEAMFISEMMKPMFESIKPDARFGGGKGEEVFRGFMVEEYGKMMAETGQIGIADAVKQELIRMQELAENPRAATEPTLIEEHANAK
jgi:Rod binding domain-containing protein